MNTKIYKMKSVSNDEFLEMIDIIKRRTNLHLKDDFVSDIVLWTDELVGKALQYNASFLAAKDDKARVEAKNRALEFFKKLANLTSRVERQWDEDSIRTHYGGVLGSACVLASRIVENLFEEQRTLRNSVVFYRLDNKETLFVCNGNAVAKAVAELSKEDDFFKKFRVESCEHFGEQPKDGMEVGNLVDRDELFGLSIWDKAKPMLEKISQEMPDIEQIMKDAVESRFLLCGQENALGHVVEDSDENGRVVVLSDVAKQTLQELDDIKVFTPDVLRQSILQYMPDVLSLDMKL